MVEKNVEKAEEKTEEKTEEKMVDSKNIILRVKSIRRLFYMNTILLMFVYILSYIIPYIYPKISDIELLVISAIMMTIVMIFYCIILIRLSSVAKGINSPTTSLAEKMMSCKLRIKGGLDYCVRCPDSYTCASGNKK